MLKPYDVFKNLNDTLIKIAKLIQPARSSIVTILKSSIPLIFVLRNPMMRSFNIVIF